jgi:hypothetical protein
MLLISCNADKPVHEASEAVIKSTGNIKDASKELSDGLKGVDPAGIKQLLNDNTHLREVADNLRTQLNGMLAPASIGVTPNTGFSLEITGSTGELWLTAWLDQEAHRFFQNQPIHDRDVSLPVTYNIADTMVNGTWKWCEQNPMQGPANVCFVRYIYPSKSAQVDGGYKAAVDKAFQEFLAQPYALPVPDIQVSAIQHWTMISGEHQLHFRVTPKKLDRNGKWSPSYVTYITRPNTSKEVVFQGAMSSEKYGVELNKPVEEVLTSFPIVVTQ